MSNLARRLCPSAASTSSGHPPASAQHSIKARRPIRADHISAALSWWTFHNPGKLGFLVVKKCSLIPHRTLYSLSGCHVRPAQICPSQAAGRYLSSRAGQLWCTDSRFHKCCLIIWAGSDRAGVRLAMGV